MWPIRETEKGVTFQIRVMPRSPRCEVAGLQDGALKIRITSPPVEGKANDECIRFLADQLNIRRSQIEIIAGHKSRSKTISITGLKKADAEVLFSEK
jgi:uncharacterized protein (TIGR00251 family)